MGVAAKPRAGPPLFQLGGDEAVGQPGSEYRNRPATGAARKGKRANVVLVTVGYQDAPHPLGPLNQVGYVGDDEVHAQHPFLRETGRRSQ